MTQTDELKNLIRKYAIKNAIDYGKADVGSVLGKVIMSAKGTPVPAVRSMVEKEVEAVNKMKKPELEKEFAPFRDEFQARAQETAEKTAKARMELDGVVVGKFATRWPPEPSGYQHIGHAKPIFLEAEFVKMYNGKFFLYFDDTNPEKEQQEFVDADKKDLEWLGIKFDDEYYASDNIELIYKYAKQLIKDGNAYVCGCEQETIKEMRRSMKECAHRKRKPSENMSEFEKMLSKYKDGQAVLRFKGDMKSQNTALRDPTIARIKTDKHYRQGSKYRVWPTYDLAAPIMDSTKGVTDIMRSKEYELRDELDTRILKALNLRVPRIRPFSRLNFKGNITHKREIRQLIADGVIKNWDDPRLMTLIAIKRRGIMPQAIRELVLRLGMTKTDSEVPFDMLLAENKKIIDPIAKHLFFVSEPVGITVKGGDHKNVKMALHPSAGTEFREYEIGDSLYISAEDAAQIKSGEMLRLKDLFDVKITKKGKSISAEPVTKKPEKTIQWVSDDNYVKCSVLMPGQLVDDKGKVNRESLKTVEGYVESYAKELKEHEIVQFERFGYCILDDKKKMQFIFISK